MIDFGFVTPNDGIQIRPGYGIPAHENYLAAMRQRMPLSDGPPHFSFTDDAVLGHGWVKVGSIRPPDDGGARVVTYRPNGQDWQRAAVDRYIRAGWRVDMIGGASADRGIHGGGAEWGR